jgi:glycosyltransferase involved in cell wall biosynthesis
MKNLLILYGPLLHYRIPLFNELSKKYNLTVLSTEYSGDISNLKFELILKKPAKIWRFYIHFGLKKVLKKKSFDSCIVFLDIGYLSYLQLIFFPLNCKTITWGAWLTKSKLSNLLRLIAIKKADASIFYSDKFMQDFIKLGVNREKLFVANNTIKVLCDTPSHYILQKDAILSVGSLNPRKGNKRLINIFNKMIHLIPENINLVFVGSGPEQTDLVSLVQRYQLNKRVEFYNASTDDVELGKYYNRAIVSVSLNQAGLSVLQSMGFGVPYLTTKGCISGGEIYNIRTGINGIICEPNDSFIVKELVYLCNDIGYATKLGENAYNHYLSYCTIENYAQGFSDSIENERKSVIWEPSNFYKFDNHNK